MTSWTLRVMAMLSLVITLESKLRRTKHAPIFARATTALLFSRLLTSPSTAMDLLDLPPEIFARVIRDLVTGAGIITAWDNRKVCRKSRCAPFCAALTWLIGTFRRSIGFEVFANQPTRAFLQSKEASARSLLRQNQALYLRLRSTVEKGAYNFLPRFSTHQQVRVLDFAGR